MSALASNFFTEKLAILLNQFYILNNFIFDSWSNFYISNLDVFSP